MSSPSSGKESREGEVWVCASTWNISPGSEVEDVSLSLSSLRGVRGLVSGTRVRRRVLSSVRFVSAVEERSRRAAVRASYMGVKTNLLAP